MIAIAIASRPELLILDEPTTALDVTVQEKILGLIEDLKKNMDLSILFISHDLRVVFRLADRISIMYAGRIVEEGNRENIISQATHPYTKGLLGSIPSFEHRKQRFDAIKGKAPLFTDLPEGCKFHPRCKYRISQCLDTEPGLITLSDGHVARCIRAREIASDGITPD